MSLAVPADPFVLHPHHQRREKSTRSVLLQPPSALCTPLRQSKPRQSSDAVVVGQKQKPALRETFLLFCASSRAFCGATPAGQPNTDAITPPLARARTLIAQAAPRSPRTTAGAANHPGGAGYEDRHPSMSLSGPWCGGGNKQRKKPPGSWDRSSVRRMTRHTRSHPFFSS